MDRDYTNKLEEFIQKYYHYRYTLESGIAFLSNIKELFRDYKELFDIKVLVTPEADHDTETNSKNRRLFKSLISVLISEYHCANLSYYLYNEINVKNKKFNNTEISLNNALANLKLIKNREIRLNSGLYCKLEIDHLHPVFSQIIEIRNELSAQFGFNNYPDQIDKIHNINTNSLEQLCRKFLNDTDYIYRDITKWHLKKYLNLKIEDAAYEDILYLYNSFEFQEYFKGNKLFENSADTFSEMGIIINSNINVDLESRSGKRNSAYTYPVSVPDQIYITINRAQTIEDYKSLLGELGKSVFLGSINLEESFENKRLIDVLSLEIFKDLFKRMAYEKKWIEKYLRIKSDKNFLQFLALRDLTEIRDLCTRLIMFRYLYQSSNLNDAKKEINNSYRDNMYLKTNDGIIMLDILLNETNPYISFSSLLTVSYLEKYLMNKYDEQWWRETNTGNEVYNWWYLCSGLTQYKFKEILKIEYLNNNNLINKFEDIF